MAAAKRLKGEDRPDPEDHAFFVVRSPGRGGGGVCTSIFPNSKVLNVVRYGEADPGPAGSVMTVEFQIDGQAFVGLNGGPHFKFTEAISFAVNCHTQEELDAYWEMLSAGGGEVQCGWVTDKFGLSWQIVPSVLPELLGSADPRIASRVMKVMLTMKKLDIGVLKNAADNKS